jgi:hypothetical protein
MEFKNWKLEKILLSSPTRKVIKTMQKNKKTKKQKKKTLPQTTTKPRNKTRKMFTIIHF